MILRAREARGHWKAPAEAQVDEEIDRAARAMLANHGANAAQEAERRSKNLLQCELEGQAAKWRKIALLVRRLEKQSGP
jgi:hypothetical protein